MLYNDIKKFNLDPRVLNRVLRRCDFADIEDMCTMVEYVFDQKEINLCRIGIMWMLGIMHDKPDGFSDSLFVRCYEAIARWDKMRRK